MGDQKFMTVRAKVQPVALDYDAALELAKGRAPDPSVFDNYDAVFWRAQISNNKLDFYFTSMGNQTLQNFTRDLQNGISYQDSHDSRKLGWGQSIDGELITQSEKVDVVGENLTQVYGTFMTLDGLSINGQNTSDFVAAIRAGVWRDVSVGFFASEFICSICGKGVWDFTEEEMCIHIPGLTYDKELCWAQVRDGELAETSQVYDGATPDAAVDLVVSKANELSEERMLGERQIGWLESRYHQRIKRPAPIYRGAAISTSKEGEMTVRSTVKPEEEVVDTPEVEDDVAVLRAQDEPEDVDNEQADEVVDDEVVEVEETTIVDPEDVDEPEAGDDEDDSGAEERTVQRARDLFTEQELDELAKHGVRLGNDSPANAIRALVGALKRERGKVSDIRELADLGRQYRSDLIEQALKEGVRARGNDFKVEQYRAIMEKVGIEEVKMFAEDFKREADELFERKPPVTLGENTAEGFGGVPKGGTRKRNAHRA